MSTRIPSLLPWPTRVPTVKFAFTARSVLTCTPWNGSWPSSAPTGRSCTWPTRPARPASGCIASCGEKHQRYLRQLTLPLAAHKAVLEEYLLALDQGCQRVARLDDLLAAQVPQWCHYPAVQALMAMRGFQLVAATVLVAEIDDIQRFAHPRHLMAFLGLVPHEHTTGSTRRIGAITKAGNGHARWMLIETVQSALFPPKVTAALTVRQEGQSAAVKELAWNAQVRLHKRGWHLMARGVMKPLSLIHI